jgi:HK97 family phage prohead protease
MHKSFVMAEVKAAQSENPNGEFEIVMSTDSIDRDGESIVKGAFDPLPASIPVHAFHDFHDPVGRAVPEYTEDGRLVGRGVFASTARAQEIRQLVSDGVIGHTSVGFMSADRKSTDDGPPLVTKAELLEVSFVSVPSNRDAAVLMVKDYDRKTGLNSKEAAQSIHDLAVSNGAVCDGKSHTTSTEAPVTPSEDGKSPASDVAENGRLWLQRARLLVDADEA